MIAFRIASVDIVLQLIEYATLRQGKPDVSIDIRVSLHEGTNKNPHLKGGVFCFILCSP